MLMAGGVASNPRATSARYLIQERGHDFRSLTMAQVIFLNLFAHDLRVAIDQSVSQACLSV